MVFTTQSASVGIVAGAQARTLTNCCIVLDTIDTAANILAQIYYSGDGASWSPIANSSQTLNANSRKVDSALSGSASLPAGAGYIFQVRLFPSQAASGTHKVMVSYY